MFFLCLPLAAQITGVIPTSVNTQSGGTYTLLSSDNNKLVNLTGSSPAVTLPTAGGSFPNGWHAWITFNGTGTAVLTPATGTIDGASSASITASAGAGLFLTNNGSNWFSTRGTGGGGGGGGGIGSQRGIFAGRPTCDASTDGQTYFSTDTPGLTSQCTNGSNWADFSQSMLVTLPPAAGSFTTVNGGTLTQTGGAVYFTKSTSGLGVNLIALPDSTASWDVQLSGRLYITTANNECGLWVSQGTTAGTDNAYGLTVSSISGTATVFQRNYVPINGSIGDTGALNQPIFVAGIPIWFRFTRSGTTITSYTGDGVTWTAIGTFTASTITHYGFGCDPRGSSAVGMKAYHLLVQ